MIKNIIKRKTATLTFTLTALLSILSNGEVSAQQFDFEGVWYTIDGENAQVVSISESAGREVVIPENILLNNRIYTVSGLTAPSMRERLRIAAMPIDPELAGSASSSEDDYDFSEDDEEKSDENLSSGNSTLQRLTLPKSIKEIDKGFFLPYASLEGISVEEGCENFVSIEEMLYLRLGENEKLSLLCWPRSMEIEETFEFPENMKGVSSYAISYIETLKVLNLPTTVTTLETHAIFGNPDLSEIHINGALECGQRQISENPYLRGVWFGEGTEVVGYNAIEKSDRLVIFDLPRSIKRLPWHSFSGYPMYVHIGEDVEVGPKALSNIQYLNCSIYSVLDPGCMVGAEKHTTFYQHGIPIIDCTEEEGKYLQGNNLFNIIIPEEDYRPMEADKKRIESSNFWKNIKYEFVEPGCPIPVISDPEAYIEVGKTLQYYGKALEWTIYDNWELSWSIGSRWGDLTIGEKVATIDQTGLVTALSPGVTYVTFTVDTKSDYRGVVSVEGRLTVYEPGSNVEEIVTPEVHDSGRNGVYNLYGIRVGDSTDGLSPGLYIVCKNGKTAKELIK
ncbi:MAG: leucine-rich repeat protein [Bacteroides sp.]|nr:leucine-rich repeat protein [Bacteroides sp.]